MKRVVVSVVCGIFMTWGCANDSAGPSRLDSNAVSQRDSAPRHLSDVARSFLLSQPIKKNDSWYFFNLNLPEGSLDFYKVTLKGDAAPEVIAAVFALDGLAEEVEGGLTKVASSRGVLKSLKKSPCTFALAGENGIDVEKVCSRLDEEADKVAKEAYVDFDPSQVLDHTAFADFLIEPLFIPVQEYVVAQDLTIGFDHTDPAINPGHNRLCLRLGKESILNPELGQECLPLNMSINLDFKKTVIARGN